jgi:hypothetical protein
LYFERGKRKPESEEFSRIRRWALQEAKTFLALLARGGSRYSQGCSSLKQEVSRRALV